jgi:putative membrane protein
MSRFVTPTYQGADPGGLWWLHPLVTLLLLAAIVVGAVLIARQWTHRPLPATPSAHMSAVETLDVRYARGEIERADYLQRRADLLDRSLVVPAAATSDEAASPPPAQP